MSASSWSTCPRCAQVVIDAIAEAERQAHDAYGKVTAEEHQRMRGAIREMRAAIQQPTFREDYEFYGAETGTLHISYGGECEKCGLSLTVNEERPFWSATPAAPTPPTRDDPRVVDLMAALEDSLAKAKAAAKGRETT